MAALFLFTRIKENIMFGSLQNRLKEFMVIGAPEPVVGMGVTIIMYSDRHAGTVFHVTKKGEETTIIVRRDRVDRIDNNGMSESQQYKYTPDVNGYAYYFKQKRANSLWQQYIMNRDTGRLNKNKNGHGLYVGEREEYYDFSF